MSILAATLTLVLLPTLGGPGTARPDPARVRIGQRAVQAAPLHAAAERTSRLPTPAVARDQVQPSRDSIANGVLIGLGVGAGAGYFWGRGICSGNDEECLIRAVPAGIAGGAAIGAAVGAVLDALNR